MVIAKIGFRVLKIFLFFIASIILLAFIIPQYKAEKYLKIAKKDGVFNDRKRLSYTPITYFYIKHKYFDKDYYELTPYADVPYRMNNIKEEYWFGSIFGTYYAHCFYELDTLKKYKLSNSSNRQYIYEFDSQKIVGDTLKLISNSNYFYDCFGKFRNPKNLIKSFTKKEFEVVKELGDDIYRVKTKESFIKYIFIDEDKRIDLISGKIKNQEFVMTNGLRVGLTKTEVENILFPTKKISIDNINTVQLITALLGVWIDLNFDENKLIEIKIDTDYQVNKE